MLTRTFPICHYETEQQNRMMALCIGHNKKGYPVSHEKE